MCQRHRRYARLRLSGPPRTRGIAAIPWGLDCRMTTGCSTCWGMEWNGVMVDMFPHPGHRVEWSPIRALRARTSGPRSASGHAEEPTCTSPSTPERHTATIMRPKRFECICHFGSPARFAINAHWPSRRILRIRSFNIRQLDNARCQTRTAFSDSNALGCIRPLAVSGRSLGKCPRSRSSPVSQPVTRRVSEDVRLSKGNTRGSGSVVLP